MIRIPESELFTNSARAKTYADANYQESHSDFLSQLRQALLRTNGNEDLKGAVLEPGCGACDITWRLCKEFPDLRICAVDGAEVMLKYALDRLEAHGVANRVGLIHGRIPELIPPQPRYDAFICNSLLHHLPDPQVLWEYVKKYTREGGFVFIRDLIRPYSVARAREIVELHMAAEPEEVKEDLFESLCSAFEEGEVVDQLRAAKLYDFLSVEAVSDRHMVIYGCLSK